MKIITHLLYLVAFLTIGGGAFAQGLCDRGGGGFTLSTNEGCLPLPVVVTNTVPNPGADGIGYITNYNGTATQGLAFNDLLPSSSVTYSLPGVYLILQKVNTTSGQTLYHCEKVTVKEGRGVNLLYNSCGGGKVNLVLTQDAILNAYDEVELNWGDETAPLIWKKGDPLSIEHIYASTSKTYNVTVRGRFNQGNCREGALKTVPIKFEEAQLEEIQINALEMGFDNNLSVSYKGITGIRTYVKYSSNGGASFADAGSYIVGGNNTVTIKNLNKDVPYQVKLASQDYCGGETDAGVITSMTLSAESSSGRVNLKWNRYPNSADFTSYELYANGTLLKTFTNEEVSYTDTDVDCGDFVEYSIKAKLATASSQSAPIRIKVDNTGSKGIEKATVNVSGNRVVILADVPGKSYDLTIERAESGSELFKRIMILTDKNEYLDDSNISPAEKSYCYKLSYESCGQAYPATPPICTILLQKKFSTFSWTKDLPFLAPVEKFTMLQTGSSGKHDEIEQTSNLTFTPSLGPNSDPEYTFQIKATSAGGDMESLSNAILYKRNADVFMPSAFTPNDDYKNDELIPIAEPLQSYSFTVFNRQGTVVFHTNDQAVGWNGKVKDKLAELGSYVYKIGFVDDLNQKVEKSGTFILLR